MKARRYNLRHSAALFPLLICLIGLYALTNAPFIDRIIITKEGKHYFADAPEAEIVAIGSMPLVPYSLVDDQDLIETRADYVDYLSVQYYLSDYIHTAKAVTFTLLQEGRTFQTTLIPLPFPLQKLQEETPLFLAAAFCFFIALVVGRKRQDDIRITLFSLLLHSGSAIFLAFAFWSLRAISLDTFSTPFLLGSNYLAFTYFPLFFLHFFLLFPTPKAFAAKKRFITLLYSAPLLIVPLHLTRVVYEAQQLLYLVGIGGGIAAMLYSFRDSDAVQKAQLKWILWGTMLFSIVMLMTYILPLLGILDTLYSYQVPAVAFTLLPLTIAMAVSRYRLMDIDNLIDNTLVYTLTFAILIGLDLALLYYLKSLSFAAIDNSLASLFTLWIAVILYAPLRTLVSKTVKKLFKRGTYDGELLALNLAKSLLPLERVDDVLRHATASLESTLHPVKNIAVRLDAPSTCDTFPDSIAFSNTPELTRITGPAYLYELLPDSDVPPRYASGVVAPIIGNDGRIGLFLFSDKQNQQFYSEKDLNLIELIASQTAIAIESIRAKEVAKADKEKIIQEIHDGIGGIATNISMISEMARANDSNQNTRQSIDTIAELSKDAIFEIRSILKSIDISNTSYAELAATLQRYGNTMLDPHGIAFELDTSFDGRRHSPSGIVVLNLLRIAREALTNVIKHAGATRVVASLAVTAEALTLALKDDGIGFENIGLGRGIASMRKRADDIGAQLQISADNGTEIVLTHRFRERGDKT